MADDQLDQYLEHMQPTIDGLLNLCASAPVNEQDSFDLLLLVTAQFFGAACAQWQIANGRPPAVDDIETARAVADSILDAMRGEPH